MHVSQEVRQAARALAPQYREQFAHGICTCLSTQLPTGLLQQSCPVLSLLEEHIFTDGSSSGRVHQDRLGRRDLSDERSAEIHEVSFHP